MPGALRGFTEPNTAPSPKWAKFLSQQEHLKLLWLSYLVLVKKFELFVPWWLENRAKQSFIEGYWELIWALFWVGSEALLRSKTQRPQAPKSCGWRRVYEGFAGVSGL